MKFPALAFSLVLVPSACAMQASPEKASTPSIHGSVLQEPDGQPIRKANVQLNSRTGPSAAQYSANTDAEGQFTIDDVQPGQYLVVVERPGFVQSGAGGRRNFISVQAGSGKNEFVLHMLPAAVITGKIVDSDGDPMPDVNVTAARAGSRRTARDSHDFANGATNDLGEFRISGLRAGRYKITASPPQGLRPPNLKENNNGKEQSTYLTTHYPGVLDEEQAIEVEVHAGTETRVNFGLVTGHTYRVSGSVMGVQNKGGMAQILLQGKGNGASRMPPQGLGDGGKFEFTGVLPGSYVARLITVTFEGGQPAIQMVRLGQPIEVSDGNVEGLRLQAQPDGQIRGKFHLDTDQKLDWTQLTVSVFPVEEHGSEIVFEGGVGLPTSSSVTSEGTFELNNVPAGSYQLMVGARSKNLADYFTKSVTLDGRDVSDSGFPVSSQTFLDVVVSANGASIVGTVVDDKGQPVANATVVDVPGVERQMRLDLYQRDTTDEGGHFSLRGLNPGKYMMFAFDELQGDVREPEFLKSYETRGETVQLDEGTRKSIVLKVIPYDSEAP